MADRTNVQEYLNCRIMEVQEELNEVNTDDIRYDRLRFKLNRLKKLQQIYYLTERSWEVDE